MQSFSAPPPDPRPRLLVVELWGLGDVALVLPFVRAAARSARVTLLAKPGVAPLVQRACPGVELLPFTAPWTAHRGKYRLHRWPWAGLGALVADLRQRRFAAAVSARPDPRDHALMALAGAGFRAGFPRAGSALLLTDSLDRPASPHRAAAWAALAARLGVAMDSTPVASRPASRAGRILLHTGAAQPTRAWPRDRFEEIARRLRAEGRDVTVLDATSGDLPALMAALDTADRFIGNDSGPGHLAALAGVPTFTIFGAQLAENFLPVHPRAGYIEGAACPHKPCHDYCRFARPHCIQDVTLDQVWSRLEPWLDAPDQPPSTAR